MLDPATTALLRAILDEVCEGLPRSETGLRAHVASKMLDAAGNGIITADGLRQVAMQSLRKDVEPWYTRPHSLRALSPFRHFAQRQRCGDSICSPAVNFQVTVLKILISYPDGFASMPAFECLSQHAGVKCAADDVAEPAPRLRAGLRSARDFDEANVT